MAHKKEQLTRKSVFVSLCQRMPRKNEMKRRREKQAREKRMQPKASFIAAMTPKGPENNQGNVETYMFIHLNLIIVCIDGCSGHELPCVGSFAPWVIDFLDRRWSQ
jgi:hypothetical protein